MALAARDFPCLKFGTKYGPIPDKNVFSFFQVYIKVPNRFCFTDSLQKLA